MSSTMERWDVYRLSFRPQGGNLKIPSGGHITRGICDVPARRDFPETGCGRRTIQHHIARRGGLFALSFIVSVERPAAVGGEPKLAWNSALFRDSGRRSLHATPVPQKVVPAGSHSEFPLIYILKSPYRAVESTIMMRRAYSVLPQVRRMGRIGSPGEAGRWLRILRLAK